MPRRARLDVAGALHHIIVRGIERKRIFQDDFDRGNFLDRLEVIIKETSTSCYAWVLMPNHVHLLLRTGTVPISTVMARLLTGYAISYNRRHRRHGQLFQNRYKSFLCQEEPYLLELVRYIHLNPVRARIVPDISALESYPYSGHSVLMGKRKNSWQDARYILGQFGRQTSSARKAYGEFVAAGVARGRRPELVGGGLIRSIGGWERVKDLRKGERVKGDERILGDSEFALGALREAEERFERKYRLKAGGYGLEDLEERVADLFGLEPGEIRSPGKYPRIVQARSLFCYWAVRELGESATRLAKEFGLSQPAISLSVQRGEQIAKEKGFRLEKED
ncbi:MAG: transposase [Pseudomonadota bacterium]